MSASKGPDSLAPSHWFFLRGLGRESAHWGDFLARFRAAMPGSVTTALDLPGFGAHVSERSPLSIGAIVERVRIDYARARHTEANRVPFLFAISLGGMVAAEWFTRDPDAFAGGVLVNSSFRGFSPALRRLQPEAVARLIGIATAQDALTRERRVLAMISNRPELRERTAAAWAKIQIERDPHTKNFIRQLVAATRFRPEPSPPKPPLLLLNSALDRMVHPSCSAEISARWRLPLLQHPRAGHDLGLDDPQWTIDSTADWARSLPASSWRWG